MSIHFYKDGTGYGLGRGQFGGKKLTRGFQGLGYAIHRGLDAFDLAQSNLVPIQQLVRSPVKVFRQPAKATASGVGREQDSQADQPDAAWGRPGAAWEIR